MQQPVQNQSKSPAIRAMALIAGGLAVILVFTLTPWNLVPTEVTEQVTVLAVTEYGCVGESELGVSVVIPECTANVGDVVSATFKVPAMELNGFYDRIEGKLAMVEP